VPGAAGRCAAAGPAAAPPAPAGFDHPVWFRAIESQPLLRALLAAPLPVPGPVWRRVVGEVYRQLAFSGRGAVGADVVGLFTAHQADRAAVLRTLASGRRLLPELRACFELERIDVPVLLVWGDRDRMVSHRGARHVVAALPDTQVAVYEGVGHCPQLEAPARLVEDVEAFVGAALRV